MAIDKDTQHKGGLPQEEASKREEELLRLAADRLAHPAPDVDTEWERLRERLGIAVPRRVRIGWNAVAMAVAACGAFLLVMNALWHPVDQRRVDNPPTVIVANGGQPGVPGSSSGSAATANGGGAQSVDRAPMVVTLETDNGEDLTTRLPDGTMVWLNAKSRLTYDNATYAQVRNVRLVGEAYFEVRHDVAHPFSVSTDLLTVTDLGTAFNVRAFSPKAASVVLVSGKAGVTMAGDEQGVLLKPGQMASVDRTGMHLSEVDAYPFTQRKRGLFYFHDAPLGEVMAEISRWYGINVVFEDTAAMDTRVHFVDERRKTLKEVVGDLNSIDGVSMTVGKAEITVK